METSLRQRLQDELKVAMKAGDQTARDTIRYTLAALSNAEIEKRGDLDDAEATTLLQREVKRRVDSIDQFRNANRDDLVAREEAQLAILKRFLPAELSDEELTSIIAAVVADLGATSPKEMGRVMPVAIERVGGRADGRRISAAVKAALTASRL